MTTLSGLVFSDLFVTEDVTTSWYKPTPDSLRAVPVPLSCRDEMQKLREHLDGLKGKSDFKVEWAGVGDPMRLRVERMPISGGLFVYVCRRYCMLPGSLTALGVPRNIAEKLLVPELREGLVIFFGKAGSGKSTTAASFVIERLARFGGVCWTAENPIELPLQGKHGLGWCYQTEAETDDDIGPAIRHMLRASPNIILIGELRDGLAVKEAISAATSGHLVVATLHASDLVAGIARLVRLAGDDRASLAVADALRVAMHLSLHNEERVINLPGETSKEAAGDRPVAPPRVLSVESLWMTGTTADALKSIVRDGDFHMLKSEVVRQRRELAMGQNLTNR